MDPLEKFFDGRGSTSAVTGVKEFYLAHEYEYSAEGKGITEVVQPR